VIELAEDLGIPCREADITPYDVYNADEGSSPAPASASCPWGASTGSVLVSRCLAR